ncbi:phage Gp37/Gp68 family protein [Pseudoxanthomonas winnipegensis]|uniref:Phage Gp37/Gp68 family protein n=1 Tax=Pseudoxanthomonas winnipegensis TaxID=2480810 RepID=A0ABY1WCU0_9GAMM|nr:phage Gp37/Gp68 family protein [Pseudoxanthomonas winnipegensis]TAA12428.1 phage Gp37/Gp68 family protein [Pseudoxanthomonas winnipegensis]TAA19206.1 phage Gp37/Gp68 family protein [Pseudoxanthomonas winnipegensis]TAH70467.1 phage Gp37/Gp68 family protein [Pseudoxanthomonas winnipegensis]
MAERSSIEWCDSTFNPWIGCTRVSPACDHCYAAASTPARTLDVTWGTGEPRRRTAPSTWNLPRRWNARPFWQCDACGWRGDDHPELRSYCPGCARGVVVPARRRVFCASLADVFDNEVDPAWRADLFALIEATPNLDWLLLTKRIGNVLDMVEEASDLIDYGEGWQSTWGQGVWPSNVWLGATICNQVEADRDIPKLLAVPAAVRFLSMEPLLGRVDLCNHLGMWWNQTMGCFESTGSQFNPGGLNWVIVGGESGPAARPVHPNWLRSLRDQCTAAAVPFLFKQWGEWAPAAANDVPGNGLMARVGKKSAGRVLDGAVHASFPEVASA